MPRDILSRRPLPFFFGQIAICLLVAGPLLVSGCGSSASRRRGDLANATEEEKAEREFNDAVRSLNRGQYQDALTGFNVVRSRYPYSSYAVEANLKIADTHYEMQSYPEAVESYRAFVRFHPTHPQVEYAAFMVGKTYHRQLPRRWPLLPAPHEKDQTAAREALVELVSFVNRYPDGERREEADEMIRQAKERLAAHELYVANFHVRRKRPTAALSRLEGLVDRYPDTESAAEGLLLDARLQAEAGDSAAAAERYRAFLERFPGDDRAASVRRRKEQALGEAVRRGAPGEQPVHPGAVGGGDPPQTDEDWSIIRSE